MIAPITVPRHPRLAATALLSVMALIGATLQGCADSPKLPLPNVASGTDNPIQISRTQIAHAVTFPQAGSEPGEAQMSALFAFIAANSVGSKDTILVQYGGQLIDQARAETISARLAAVELHPSVVAGANLSSGVVRVVVERYVAIAPDCPEWSHKPSPNYQNDNQRNFGCADAANLAAMVADPKDLAMGANLPAQVGDPVTRPVSNYRAGIPGGAPAGGASGASAGGTSPSGAASGTSSSAPSAAGPT